MYTSMHTFVHTHIHTYNMYEEAEKHTYELRVCGRLTLKCTVVFGPLEDDEINIQQKE